MLRQMDFSSFASGALSGLVTCMTLQPFDVLKTRLQEEKAPLNSLLKYLIRNDGVFGLWKGLGNLSADRD